jgi:hypothetical protein
MSAEIAPIKKPRKVQNQRNNMSAQKIPIVIRFWRHVKKTRGCWLWIGTRREGRCGRIFFPKPGRRRSIYAHRFAWIITYGPIPKGKSVLHSCDNSECVRPGHLFLGTRTGVKKTPIEVRFWRHVKKTRGCWLWMGTHTKIEHYGKIYRGPPGKFMLAHRLAWILAHGPIPKGKLVLHKCDNPPCVRESHLFLGTHLDNNKDKVNKGRHVKGERCHMHKLTEKDVIQIRKLLRSGRLSKVKIAGMFGVVGRTIRWIETRHTWKHLK